MNLPKAVSETADLMLFEDPYVDAGLGCLGYFGVIVLAKNA